LRDIRNISLHFTENEHSFILSMARQCAVNSSFVISKGAILRTLIRMLQRLEVDVSGVRTEDQLLQCLQDAIKGD